MASRSVCNLQDKPPAVQVTGMPVSLSHGKKMSALEFDASACCRLYADPLSGSDHDASWEEKLH